MPDRGLPLAALAALLLTAPGSGISGEAAGAGPPELLSRVRQLTFEGRRAGEGYFSPDGKRLVFQSEREPGNPFFQIYELDLEEGETRRVSPGSGKTTCAFHRPGKAEILFASTHHDPRSAEHQRAEFERRAAGQARRYDWDFDPEMELYVERAGALVRLTDVRGYDAEGSYSPDGQWIVFTSTRSAYEGEPTEEQARRLEADPSYFAELYVMRADGTGVRRLTETPGYDGGPFFMPDGERILWRRFAPDGAVADIWTMRADGSGVRRLTEFGSMSWAPYPHPSGEYVFFTSNKHGMSNFELFIVDSLGVKQPVRVTDSDGFDGLPVPSPDGRRLAWTSTRSGGGGGQIFLGDWDHDGALEALRLAPDRPTRGGE